MKNIKAIIALACLSVGTVSADTLVFSKSGFSIDSLENQQISQVITPVQMLLPATNGFSPNVNVQIQPYAGTIAEYKALTETQFEQIGFTLMSITENEGGESLSIEYKGAFQGQNLRWYAKAYKKDNLMYVVTATNTEANWEQHKEQLIANVESFRLL